MTDMMTSRVAEMLFADLPHCDFYRTISDLDAVLARICGSERTLTWDCDDVACFDMPGTRILLSLADSPYAGYKARLVISVGPSNIPGLPHQEAMVHAAMCSRLVSRLSERCAPQEVLWSEVAGIVTADEVDCLADGIAQPEPTPRRPEIFTPGSMRRQARSAELQPLRRALHPYGVEADFPAATARLARQTMDLARTMAQLPFTAAHYAASVYRAAVH